MCAHILVQNRVCAHVGYEIVSPWENFSLAGLWVTNLPLCASAHWALGGIRKYRTREAKWIRWQRKPHQSLPPAPHPTHPPWSGGNLSSHIQFITQTSMSSAALPWLSHHQTYFRNHWHMPTLWLLQWPPTSLIAGSYRVFYKPYQVRRVVTCGLWVQHPLWWSISLTALAICYGWTDRSIKIPSHRQDVRAGAAEGHKRTKGGKGIGINQL